MGTFNYIKAAENVYEAVLKIKCKNQSKGPKLLFNTSIHSLPIKIVQTGKDSYLSFLQVKNKVTAVLGRPLFEDQHGSCNSKRHNKTIWRVLLDSGSDGDILFQRKGLNKKRTVPYTTRLTPKVWQTSMGLFKTEKVGDFDLTFPEYSGNKRLHLNPDILEFDPDDYEPKFDLIIGTETMEELGIVLNFKRRCITIDQIELPMRRLQELQQPNLVFQMFKNPEPLSTADLTKRATRILDAKYEKANLQEIVDTCTHLDTVEREQLLQLLEKFEHLFDGNLGDWNTRPVHLELKEGARPYHGRAFPVPRIHRETLKKEVERMVELGILKWEGESEWAFPSFIIPKSNQTVRFISDFRELNKLLKRKPWPLPKIMETLQQLEGFTYVSQLDLNMGYYTIRLDADSSKICTIILPWGKYSYLRLPMGVAGSPDIFQEKMSGLMSTLEYVRTYLDDLLIISQGDFNDHLEKLQSTLQKLQDAGLKVNCAKSTFGVHECEYLGYVLTREGIKPQRKKIEAILAIDPPKDVKSLRGFLGIVQYYRDLWEKRSAMLAPLSDLVAECGTSKPQRKAGVKKAPWH